MIAGFGMDPPCEEKLRLAQTVARTMEYVAGKTLERSSGAKE